MYLNMYFWELCELNQHSAPVRRLNDLSLYIYMN